MCRIRAIQQPAEKWDGVVVAGVCDPGSRDLQPGKRPGFQGRRPPRFPGSQTPATSASSKKQVVCNAPRLEGSAGAEEGNHGGRRTDEPLSLPWEAARPGIDGAMPSTHRGRRLARPSNTLLSHPPPRRCPPPMSDRWLRPLQAVR